jgi:hypothetical protein
MFVPTQASRSAYTHARRGLLAALCSVASSAALWLRKRCLGLCRGPVLVQARFLRVRFTADLNRHKLKFKTFRKLFIEN